MKGYFFLDYNGTCYRIIKPLTIYYATPYSTGLAKDFYNIID